MMHICCYSYSVFLKSGVKSLCGLINHSEQQKICMNCGELRSGSYFRCLLLPNGTFVMVDSLVCVVLVHYSGGYAF